MAQFQRYNSLIESRFIYEIYDLHEIILLDGEGYKVALIKQSYHTTSTSNFIYSIIHWICPLRALPVEWETFPECFSSMIKICTSGIQSIQNPIFNLISYPHTHTNTLDYVINSPINRNEFIRNQIYFELRSNFSIPLHILAYSKLFLIIIYYLKAYSSIEVRQIVSIFCIKTMTYQKLCVDAGTQR